MGYNLRREEDEHHHIRYFVSWGDRVSYEIGMDQIYGVWIHSFDSVTGNKEERLGYIYSDAASLVSEALVLLMQEKEDQQAASKRAHDHWQRTCTDTVFHGWAVDLSPAATFEALQGVEARLGQEDKYGRMPEIKYKGKWLVLGRTDLKDDVRTSGYLTSDKVRDYIDGLAASNYGARVSDETFSVVDAMTVG